MGKRCPRGHSRRAQCRCPSAMVVKTETCSFSGLKIYPGHGILFVRADQKSFKFISRKCKSMSTQRLNPRKIAWTQVYRRMHKKGTLEESQRAKAKQAAKKVDKPKPAPAKAPAPKGGKSSKA